MAKKLLNSCEIRELIQILRNLFKHYQNLQNENELARFIQRPKIPPFLSESLIVDMGNRGLLSRLRCTNFDLSNYKGDVIAYSLSGNEVKIEVKATAISAFQLLSERDILADYLVWVHFGSFFESKENHEVIIFILPQPRMFFSTSRKITLPVFKKACKDYLIYLKINLNEYPDHLLV